jgi:hypothetical protein
MKISVQIDTDEVVRLTAAVLRQLPYAASKAITRTAKEAVEAGQQEVTADLTMRKKFIISRIRILQYAKPGNLTAIVGVNTNVQGAPLILGFLEEGGEKTPLHGSELAIPITGEPARPSFQQSVPTALRYTNLRFENRRGRKRTYIVPNVGIFQRIASGDSPGSTVLLYSFKPSVRLPKHMALKAAMVRVFGERFNPIFTEEFTKEILQKARRGS